jgi:hypothetical protein
MMKIFNVHERSFDSTTKEVGKVLASLSGDDDILWPKDRWHPIRFDSPLGVGARGGHGPIHYHVSEYIPEKRVAFEFEDKGLSKGFDGRHYFEIVPFKNFVLLRHVVDIWCDFKTWLRWHLIIGPLHDALLEDALDNAEKRLTADLRKGSRWSIWVRFLRRIMARKR